MSGSEFDQRVAAIRGFNRFYTTQIGVLHEGLLQSPFSLTEARVLYELAHRDEAHRDPARQGAGPGRGISEPHPARLHAAWPRSPGRPRRRTDAKASSRSPEKDGGLSRRSTSDRAPRSARCWRARPAAEQARLIQAMRTIEDLLGARPERAVASYLLRPPEPGDMGWVVHRHGGTVRAGVRVGRGSSRRSSRPSWRNSCERFDPKRERCWIAEREGQTVGSVFLVSHSKTVAQLRLLLVEPTARGLGIGARLVNECERFAPPRGLPQDHALDQQRPASPPGISTRRPAFAWSPEKRHRSFGHDLVGETWELAL